MREFIKEQEFKTQMTDTVLPYLTKRAEKLTLHTRDGKSLYAVKYTADRPRGTVVVVHGFSENADKYCEFIYYLLRDGLSVLIYDQRGHGRSHRNAPVNIIHVDRFCDYLDDLEAVIEQVRHELTAPLYLFAHSMGGAVAMLYLEKHGSVFEKALLSAPMISLQYWGPSRAAAAVACRFCALTGRAKKPVFIVKRDYKNETFEHSTARSPARFSYLHELRISDPRLTGGSPSYKWSLAALGVTKSIFKKHAPTRVKIPVRIFAAEHERLVSPVVQKKLAAALPDCQLKTVAGSKHEILLANDEILHPVLEEMLDFLQ